MSKVLIIEDELHTAQPVKEALALESIPSDIANDGTTGLAMFVEGDYDLVLLDLKMPGMSGEEVLTAIRKEDPFVDIIIYTNYTDFEDIKRLTNIGIDGYINKGAGADLFTLVDAIKKKLAPLSDDMIDILLDSVPDVQE